MKILAALLALLSTVATAATATLTFIPPTQFEDGTIMPLGTITGYEAQCVSWSATTPAQPGACPQFANITLPAAATGGVMTGTIPATGGQACFQVRTVAGAGVFSVWSAAACKTFAALVPKPPTGLTIAVVIGINVAPLFSYSAVNNLRGSAMVGFAPVGAECVGSALFTYRGKGYKQLADGVPIQWWSSAARSNVAAPCG